MFCQYYSTMGGTFPGEPLQVENAENLINSMRVAITGGVIFIIVIPLAIIGIGVFIWMRRKKL